MFYVLDGRLSMTVEDELHELGPDDALNVAPGTRHRAYDDGDRPVRFLVVSAPTTRGDRRS